MADENNENVSEEPIDGNTVEDDKTKENDEPRQDVEKGQDDKTDEVVQTDNELKDTENDIIETVDQEEDEIVEEVVKEKQIMPPENVPESAVQLEPVETKSLSIYLETESSQCFSDKSLISLNPPKSWPSDDGCSFFRVSSNSDRSCKSESESITSSATPSESESICLTVSKVESSLSTSLFSTSTCTEIKTPVENVVSSDTSNMLEGFPYLLTVFPLPVNENILNKMKFRECLFVALDIDEHLKEEKVILKLLPPKNQQVGGYCLNVNYTNCTIITFATSQFSLDGSGAKSSILSTTDFSFNLLDEIKTETQCFRSCKIEKSLHVVRENNNYVAFRKEIYGHEERKYRANINIKKAGDFVLDGGTFALMRYLIISKFIGVFATWTMDIHGNLGKYVFEVGKIQTIRINHRPYSTILIKKTLFRHNKRPDFSYTYFLRSGHIVRHRWIGCQYFLHINPLLSFTTMQLRPEDKWENDIVLVSQYLNEKEKIKYDIQEYFHENPEIKDLLKDYLLCLLQMKPSDILNFSIEFFLNLYKD